MARGFTRLEGDWGGRALRDLSKAVQRGVGKRALAHGGAVIVRRLKAQMPVSDDPSNPTPGSLRDGTTTAPAKSERGDPRQAVLVEDPAAVPGEFGTSKMRPHLKIRATVNATREEAGVAIGQGVKVEVDRAVARAAKRKG